MVFERGLANPRVKKESFRDPAPQHQNLADFELILNRPLDAVKTLQSGHQALAQMASPSADDLYIDAQLCAQSYALLARESTAFTAAEQTERSVFADLAMAALHRAAPGAISLKTLQEDPILNRSAAAPTFKC